MITIRSLISALDSDDLTADAAYVWTTSLEVNPPELAALCQVLAKDERERTRRYRFDIDRRRFIAPRGRLRQVLPFGNPVMSMVSCLHKGSPAKSRSLEGG